MLHLGNLSDPRELDPHVVTGVTEHNVIAALLEGLVGEDPADLHPVPAVAERWDVSDDARCYTFHLRPAAQWSNGDSVTAADFVFSFQRILSTNMGSPYAYMLYGLMNAEAFHAGRISDFSQVGAEAVAPKVLRLRLEYPIPYFLSLLTHFSWLPVHPATVLKFGAMDQIGSPWTKPGNFVGNGPFVLTTWESGKKIVVARSPTYWDRDRVRLNGITFHPIGDANIEERAFRAGQLHVTGTLPIDRIEWYRSHRPEVLRLAPYLGTYYYLFNVKRAPLSDVRVRRALALAIDRDQIVRYVTRGGETPALHFTPGVAGYEAQAQLAGGIGDAKRLLAEAGFPNGQGFPKLELLYNTAEAHERIAQAVQQMWKTQLGVEVQLLNMEWKVYLARTQDGEYDIARAGWIGDYADPNTFLDIWVTDGGNNRTGWSSPEYDRLIRQAA
jgi:oligopeptide transport system substrate-binding protein